MTYLELIRDAEFKLAHNEITYGEYYEMIEPLRREIEQEPKVKIALERYKDLQDYFGDEEVAKLVLEDQKEFKMWLERLRWHTKKVDELTRELETLKRESCGDAISRQSVVDTTLNSKSSFKNDFACGFFIDKIRELTPVTPQEPKTGRWIIVDDCENFIARCSVCGRKEDSRMIHRYPYCHCGARMKSEG